LETLKLFPAFLTIVHLGYHPSHGIENPPHHNAMDPSTAPSLKVFFDDCFSFPETNLDARHIDHLHYTQQIEDLKTVLD